MHFSKEHGFSSAMSRFASICEDGFETSKPEVFAETLAWAIRTGTPELVAIEMLKKQLSSIWDIVIPSKYSWERCLHKVALDLMDGKKLSSSLKVNMRFLLPEFFLLGIVEAEEQGILPEALEMLAARIKYTGNLQRYWWANLFLPGTEFLAISILASMFLVFTMPKFKKLGMELLEGDFASLPLLSHLLFDIPREVLAIFFATEERELMTVIFIILTPLFIFIIAFIWHDRHFKAIRRGIVHGIMLRLPFVNRGIKNMAMLEINASMATFTSLGMDVTSSAEWCIKSTNYSFMRKCLKKFIEKASSGYNWLDAWEEMGIGTNKDNWILRNSASREKVREGFDAIVQSKRYEIASSCRIISSFLEFALTIFNACIVVFILFGTWSLLLALIDKCAQW